MKIGLLLKVCTSLLSVGVGLGFAQQRVEWLTAGGASGIYVNLGNEIASKNYPFNYVIGYRIERRKKGETEWRQLAEVEAPTSLKELQARLEKLMHYTPEPVPLSKIPVKDIWNKVERYRRLDALRVWSGTLVIRLSVGVTYIDTTAERNTVYEYRVSKLDLSGMPQQTMISYPVSYPQPADLAPLQLVTKRPSEEGITLKWIVGEGRKPTTFRAFRREELQGDFKLIQPTKIITMKKDLTFFIVQDTLITPGQVYEYFVLPMDFYGNPGTTSDTALVAPYTFLNIPPPQRIKTQSMDSLGGIRLTWHLPRPENVKSLKIFRSEIWDTGYVQIAELSPRDTAYIDQTTEPMKKYYYYLVMTGHLGEESPASARVFGIFHSALAPLPPVIICSQGLKNGVRLEILSTEQFIAGYRVYRGKGYGMSLTLISDLVPYKDSVTVFIDSSSVLSGKAQYAYAARAENTSHIKSDFSDTVYVRPLIPTHPPTPLNLEASKEDKSVKLYWTDMISFDEALDGYFVYRREVLLGQKPPDFTKLTDSLIPANNNYFTDTTVSEGKSYEFAVQSVDIFGGVSSLSASVRIELPILIPLSPAGLRARRTPEGVLIQWDETFQDSIVTYKIYRYERGKEPQFLATVPLGQNEFLDKTASPGNLYFYYVTCVNTKDIESRPGPEVGIRP